MKNSYTIDEVNLMDDVFFSLVASDPEVGEEFCKTLLSVLLQKHVTSCTVNAQRFIPGTGLNLRGVRLDVEVKEQSADASALAATVYDIEPHTHNDSDFPRLLRFRQAKIDSRFMKSGDNDFSHLPDLYVILISDFDPFNKDYMMYTVKNRCIELPELEYKDGLTYFYFNTRGKKGGSESIENMLEFMQNSREEAVSDEATRELNKYVQSVRMDPAIRGKYMTFGDKLDRVYEEAHKEGFSQGELSILTEQICKKLARGKNLPNIAEELEADEDDIRHIYEVAIKYAPEYDSESVFAELQKENLVTF